MHHIAFSVPRVAGREAEYVSDALGADSWHGDGRFSRLAASELSRLTGCPDVLLTPSCTQALDLAAILLDLGPGDEVICPSFTFSSTAACIALRGATPVFVDVRPDDFNLDTTLVACAVSARTRAIFVVHYGGVAADMTGLQRIAAQHDLVIVEDNAHGLGGCLDHRPLGTFGTFATQSFHDTKNVTCGEGGALLINDSTFRARAEIIREKGTNRAELMRGTVDKYEWVDQGSSLLSSEITAAILLAQLEEFDTIQAARHRVWNRYSADLASWAEAGGVRQMSVPSDRSHPAHLYYLVLPSAAARTRFIEHMAGRGIVTPFHYQSLHASPAGRAFGRTPFPCPQTEAASAQLVRLPLHAGLSTNDIDEVVGAATAFVV